MIILGIETSCDETGAAIIRADRDTAPVTLLSNVIATSLALHAETGGIIPEIAAREQLKYCLPVIEQAMAEAGVTKDDLDAIAVTYGPGLIGSLLVGVETARTLSYVWGKPLLPVNHLYGHIYANWIADSTQYAVHSTQQRLFPALALVVSGGHTDLVLLKKHGDLTVIGGTRDDAAGEAFDKIGRLLGLPYPAGPVISQLAERGNPRAFPLPRPMVGSGDFDFSFSGLKTAVLNIVKKNEAIQHVIQKTNSEETPISLPSEENRQDDKILMDLCASVEEAIIDVLVKKTLKAAQHYQVETILLGGGVAANTKLQQTLRQKAKDLELAAEIFVPQKFLCTDNGAMIAAAAFFNQNPVPWSDLTANPELYY